MEVLVKYLRCYLGRTLLIKLPLRPFNQNFQLNAIQGCVDLSNHVHVAPIFKFSCACNLLICGERTPTEEGQEIQCTDTVHREEKQHIRYPEHQIPVRRNKDTEQVETTSDYH